MILIVLLYAVLASTFIFAKHTLEYARPLFLIGFRMIFASFLILGYQYFFTQEGLRIKREDIGLFIGASLFHIYFAFVLEFWALQYTSALKTTMIYSSTPFIAALLSFFILKERLSFVKIIGMIIGIGGLAPVFMQQIKEGGAPDFLQFTYADGVLFLAVLSATYAWFIVGKLMKRGYHFGFINGIAMLWGGILSMITAIPFEGSGPFVDDWPKFLGWLILLILSANIVVYNLYAWLLKRYSITFISFSGFLCPIFATLYDWLFLSGELRWHTIVSLILITIGLYVFYRDELQSMRKSKKPYPHAG